MHEIGLGAHRFAHHLYARETLEDLLPQHGELQFSQTIADAAVNAEAEGDVLARPRTVDDETVGLLDRIRIAVAGQVPHHHLVALADLLAGEFDVGQRGATHVRQWRLPADDLGYQACHQRRVVGEFGVLVRMAVQRKQAAADRIARGVVAADDEQDQVAEKLLPPHIARRGRMGQHGDQVILRWRIDPFIPQPREIVQALAQFAQAHLPGGHRAVAVRIAGGHVGPPGQETPVLERKIEQGRQHLRGQFHRHPLHPVELCADGQAIEDAAGTLANG